MAPCVLQRSLKCKSGTKWPGSVDRLQAGCSQHCWMWDRGTNTICQLCCWGVVSLWAQCFPCPITGNPTTWQPGNRDRNWRIAFHEISRIQRKIKKIKREIRGKKERKAVVWHPLHHPAFCIVKDVCCLIKMRLLQSKILFGQGHGVVDSALNGSRWMRLKSL